MSLNQPLLLSSALVHQMLLNSDLSIQTSDRCGFLHDAHPITDGIMVLRVWPYSAAIYFAERFIPLNAPEFQREDLRPPVGLLISQPLYSRDTYAHISLQ